jgi:paxillin
LSSNPRCCALASKEDYLKLLKDICSFCHKPIIGRSFTALGRVWHPEHFVCYHCKEPLGTSSYMEKDGNPYCKFFLLFACVRFVC